MKWPVYLIYCSDKQSQQSLRTYIPYISCINTYVCAFVGEEYIKSLVANPDLVDRLACVSDEGVCFYFLFLN